MVVSIVHFLLIMSIPVIGGAFLYCELRWNLFRDKSIGYGCLYALGIMFLLLANHETRFLGRMFDRMVFGKHQTLQYVAPANARKEALRLDVKRLKDLGAEILDAKEESDRWVVINYKADKNLLDKSMYLQKILETPILKCAKQ